MKENHENGEVDVGVGVGGGSDGVGVGGVGLVYRGLFERAINTPLPMSPAADKHKKNNAKSTTPLKQQPCTPLKQQQTPKQQHQHHGTPLKQQHCTPLRSQKGKTAARACGDGGSLLW